jgi:hypothetical protein
MWARTGPSPHQSRSFKNHRFWPVKRCPTSKVLRAVRPVTAGVPGSGSGGGTSLGGMGFKDFHSAAANVGWDRNSSHDPKATVRRKWPFSVSTVCRAGSIVMSETLACSAQQKVCDRTTTPTNSITARRSISGDVLNYRKGLYFIILKRYGIARPPQAGFL